MSFLVSAFIKNTCLAKYLKLSLVLLLALFLIAPAHAQTNVSLLYGWNGTTWTPLLTSAAGKLQTDLNFTESIAITPLLNNTYNFSTATLQWAGIFVTNVRSAGDLSLYAGNTERVTVKAGGNAGVGNTNPQQKFVVSGTANVTGDFIVDDTTLFVDSTLNRVGIGTASPQQAFVVSGLANITSNLTVDDTTLFVDALNNRVGIGTATPSRTLTVIGELNITGYTVLNGSTTIRGVNYTWPSADGSANQLLTTNAAGALSWTAVSAGSSSLPADNISSGSFGANTGAGDYTFPRNLSVTQNISAGDRVSDKTGYVAPVGLIILYTASTPPTGWLMANGSEVSRTTYADLFAVFNTTYGNTSSTTFTLPDLRQRFVLGVAASGTGSTLGGVGGGIDHTHTGPSHTHTYSTVIAHTHAVDPPSTGSDSQGAHTHSMDPLSTASDSQGSSTHTADPPSTGLSISDSGHTHNEGGNSLTFVGGGGSFTTGSITSVLSESTGSSTTGITASNVDIGSFATASGGGHTHTTDVASFTSGSGGGSTHSTDIGSFTSGSTGSASGTSDAGGTGATGTGNPPFIALNYIIKY